MQLQALYPGILSLYLNCMNRMQKVRIVKYKLAILTFFSQFQIYIG